MSATDAILDAIGELEDEEIDIADAALQLARAGAPEADWQATRAHLTLLARDAAAMALDVAEGDLAARADALASLMTGRHGYQGDAVTYDNLDNANLIRVIERRRGLQVALGILWLHAARAAGWGARGINFPGHFLFALEGETDQGRALVVLDVFKGGAALSRRDLSRMLRRVGGKDAALGPNSLAAMANRDVLIRLQSNITSRLVLMGEMQQALDCTRDMLRVAPDVALLWREAGELHQRLDQIEGAIACYTRFLRLRPNDAAAGSTRAAMAALRGRLN